MKKIYLILIALLGIHLFLLVNLRFTAWPEMLSYPYLRNHGYLLYKDMIHPYPPLLTIGLSILYKIFGYKLIVLKLVTWLIILTNDILIFLIVKRLTKNFKLSAFGVLLYVLIQPFLEGNQLWFDLAIVPPILLAFLFFLNHKYFWSGVFLGLAALTKQTTALFLVFGFLYLIVRKTKFSNLKLFLTGPIVLFLVLLLRLITEGDVGGFLNWTLIYPFFYWSKFPGYVQMALTNRQLFVLILLFLPLIFMIFKSRKNVSKNKNLIFLVSSILISLVLIYPRFSFFHFQLGVAFLAITVGFLSNWLKIKPILLATYYILLFLLISLPVLKADWQKETRFWEEQDIKHAKIIQDKTDPNDKVFLLGPHPGLYVLANRLPPKIWSDNFGWYLEIPGVQEKIIAAWEKDPPKHIYLNNPHPGNWYDLGVYRPQKILNWIREKGINTIVMNE